MSYDSDGSDQVGNPEETDQPSRVGSETKGVAAFVSTSPEEHQERAGGILSSIRQPQLLAGLLGGTVALTSALAVRWRQGRRSAPSAESPNGATPQVLAGLVGRLVGRQVGTRKTRTPRRGIRRLSRSQDQTRRMSTQIWSQIRQKQTSRTPARSPGHQALERIEANRFTLIALLLAIGLIVIARWSDTRRSRTS